MKTDKVLDALRESYEPYAELAISELAHVDSLRKTWEQTSDPEWLAFRENPKTQELFKAAARTYQSLYKQLANDDGTLSQVERKAMDVGKKWALFYVRALGGDPLKIRREVEKEIHKFADNAGIIV
jgi:hypothetical protein